MVVVNRFERAQAEDAHVDSTASCVPGEDTAVKDLRSWLARHIDRLVTALFSGAELLEDPLNPPIGPRYGTDHSAPSFIQGVERFEALRRDRW